MGCAESKIYQETMSFFGKNASAENNSRTKLERKLYLAKESPEAYFDLSDCNLRKIPSGIFAICKVYRKDILILHSNKLESLSGGGLVSDLHLIKVLNLSCNIFSTFPSGIQSLVNLEELHLHDNLLKFIPESVQYLENLQLLDVSRNMLLSIPPSLGKLKKLKHLNLTQNPELHELCVELCYAHNLQLLELDPDKFIYPSSEVTLLGTQNIMKFLCQEAGIPYKSPMQNEPNKVENHQPREVLNPFTKINPISWEEQEEAIVQQESRYHQAAKLQREKLFTKVLNEQTHLDKEIAKIYEVKDKERQTMIKNLQSDEKAVNFLVRNFVISKKFQPEDIQQQVAYEQTEHDRLLEMTRQNYDNLKKADVLNAMEELVKEEYKLQNANQGYQDSLNVIKKSMIMQEFVGSDKVQNFLKAKDTSRNILIQKLSEDQSMQKALVASLMEKIDSKSWSLAQEISIISSSLSRLSVLEQEKKRFKVQYNLNELSQQRTQLVFLLEDLFEQQKIRRNQLIETVKEVEDSSYSMSDFWLKNYQKLLNSAPKAMLDITKNLDPLLAHFLLQEGVIHCLPFLVKFLFSENSLLNLTEEKLSHNGVSLQRDRKAIMKAIFNFIESRKENCNYLPDTQISPSAPEMELETCSGVVSNGVTGNSLLDSECVVCMDAKCEVVFVPCGHMCCCLTCSDKEIISCPMCRDKVEKKIKVIIP